MSPEKDASVSVRYSAGNSVKSSLSYRYFNDTRNATLFRDGRLISASAELAGLGGDAKFLRAELNYQPNFPLGKNLWLSLSGSTGLLIPFGGYKPRIFEKFMLGGLWQAQNVVRGFSVNGVGPQTEYGESLGGNMYFSGSARLLFPIHKVEFDTNNDVKNINIYGHIFMNNANLIEDPKKFSDWSNIRTSIGTGIIIGFGGLNFELNLLSTLKHYGSDRVHVRPFQFGLTGQF